LQDFHYINTSYENASNVYYETHENNVIDIYLIYDHERCSPNRANGHWNFQLQARKNANLTVILNNFYNVWNGKSGSPVSDKTIYFTSIDGDNLETQ
jgi:hypothetical protein